MLPADDTTLLRTKLHRPPVADDVVPRPHLLERLEAGRRHPLTLVSTPAGYGKSTLLSGWLAAAPCRTAWVSLDDGDGDPGVFLAYVVAALEGACPDAFRRTRALLGAADLPPTRVLSSSLVNELDALSEPLILVLDDYHLVRSSAVHDLVSTLIAQRPRPFHLAIAARRDPPLPLAALRAAGQMTEIYLEDLRLTGEETADFLRQIVASPIEGGEAEALREATEGWPAGLRLAALSLRKGADVARLVEGLHSTGQHVMDYLATEVLADVPSEIQDRLLATAILDRFCAPLCGTLLGPGDGGETSAMAGDEFVAWLQRANLFVIPLDEEHRWFRYHHLFREVLRHLLSVKRTSDGIATLHLNAAGWMARNGFPDEAIRHALAAGDPGFALCVVEAHRHALMNREEWPRLERWVRLFPAATVESDPQPLVVQAWLALERRYELAELERLIVQAEQRIDAASRDDDATAGLRAELAIMKGGLAYMTVPEGPELTEALQTAVDTLPADHSYAQGIGYMHLAAAHDQQGGRRRAERLLSEALERGTLETAARAQVLTTLCFLAWFDADPSRLLLASERLFRLGESERLTRSLHFSHYFAGVGHYDRNELEQAGGVLRRVVDDPYVSALHNVAHSGYLLALVQQARGRDADARETARTVTDLALELGNQHFVSLSEAFDAELALRQGRRFDALQWARRYDPHPLQAFPRFYVPQLTWLRVLLAEDTPESHSRAGAFLAEWQPHVERQHHTRVLIDTLIVRSLWASGEGDEEGAAAALGRALNLARPGGVRRPFLDEGSRLEKLLDRQSLEGDDAAFAREIRAILSGERVADVARPVSPLDAAASLASPLSGREAEILALLADRLSNKEIAEQLHITPETVKRHTANIYQKLDVHGRREAVKRARSLGVLRLP
jgi:LuxR family maltose regulon positive regulatory protein